MMSIIGRFKDIMFVNINVLLDKVENLEKMVDQYLRNMNSDLVKVKVEIVVVMVEEQRVKRELYECQVDMEKMESYVMKVL